MALTSIPSGEIHRWCRKSGTVLHGAQLVWADSDSDRNCLNQIRHSPPRPRHGPQAEGSRGRPNF